MSSRKQDMLGRLIDTALQQDDDAPSFDGKGYTALRTRRGADISDDTEDDDAFQALRESGLSPQEAQAEVDYMKPLSEAEANILEETPLLDGLTMVDDAAHQQWLLNVASKDRKGMDRVKEDAIYGENSINNNEERMEREDVDTDSGWGFHSLTHAVSSAAHKGLHAAERVAKAPFGVLAHFVPGRDAGKAALVRNTYNKLWFEHANWLAAQDQANGQPLQARSAYEATAKAWAKDQLRLKKLPVKYAIDAPVTSSGAASRAAVLNRVIIGNSAMGAWFWPFSWFQNTTRQVIADTASQRADAPPAGQDASAPAYQDVSPPADPGAGYPPPGQDDGSQGEIRMLGWNGFIKTRGLDGVLGATDSLGAYATQILGQEQPAKDNPHVDAIVQTLVFKLKNGKPIDAGEIGLLNSAAKEGNVKAQKVMAYLNKEAGRWGLPSWGRRERSYRAGESSRSDRWIESQETHSSTNFSSSMKSRAVSLACSMSASLMGSMSRVITISRSSVISFRKASMPPGETWIMPCLPSTGWPCFCTRSLCFFS